MRIRLIIAFALIVLVSVGSVVLLSGRGAASEVRSFMFRGGIVGVDDLVVSLEKYYQANLSWEGAESLVELSAHMQRSGHGARRMMPWMMEQRLRLADASGSVLVDTSSPENLGYLTQSELAYAIPLVVNRETVGYLLPEGGMFFTRDQESDLLVRLNRAALIAGLIAGGLSLLLALLLAYHLLRPIKALTNAAGNLARGDLSQRVPVSGGDELAKLGQTFNYMAASLEEAETSRRAMTADIAHELRTPLSVQRAQLEALQDGIYALNPDNLSPILEQNRLLTRLVEDLRVLAMADSGKLNLEFISTDFYQLVKRTIESFIPQASARGIQINLSATEYNENQATIRIDPQRVEQILANLFTNALRYSPDNGSIEVKIDMDSNYLNLTIRDYGPGIPKKALPLLFDRFYRVDQSRSRGEGGSGLGLSIAHKLAQSHGGSLSAANHPQGGAVFTLRLPLDGKTDRIL
jgi:two-component system, OmpR family, sensor histidine kinase BaeS